MNSNPKISIIVPVYNAEKYIQRCVSSLLSQTFSDFEIILVDDGSTDNSGVICDEYAQTDSRLYSYHKQNGGVSSARQYGLKRAVGEYVIHADPDDWVENDMFEVMYSKAIEDNAVIKPYPKNYWYEGPKNIKDCVYPSVQDWLQSFIDADFVVTDSFHGTVFSIIFNKQFISIPNTDRGLTRFKSLLNMFRLENRMVESLEQARNILKYSINFSEVQKRLSEERDKSIVFLTTK